MQEQERKHEQELDRLQQLHKQQEEMFAHYNMSLLNGNNANKNTSNNNNNNFDQSNGQFFSSALPQSLNQHRLLPENAVLIHTI
ncbi:RING zinc finger-containing protein [Reticulomyxa filosa]|uniref:RING zinc finger-containing protein n=1 Tax=Reticulomyxa filosa TaxID=46433 RepID=X6NXR1_RETFI|nr:RING zinc finger-containing protein [Reticulomyxa filosa]|eukprot:ETO31100.1 RING zinc finger-containing protein [Reticulomyxa filosa]